MHRVRLTSRDNLINYPVPFSTPTTEMTTEKLFLNIVVSTSGAKFMTRDIKYIYLNTPMLWYKYMRISITIIPQDIINSYNILPLIKNVHFLVNILKGIYYLNQFGKIAHNYIENHLSRFGYFPDRHTPGLWHQATRDIQFSITVDDFDIKYTNKIDVEHLSTALSRLYKINSYRSGKIYLRRTLK